MMTVHLDLNKISITVAQIKPDTAEEPFVIWKPKNNEDHDHLSSVESHDCW
jgi:hypothetical protein